MKRYGEMFGRVSLTLPESAGARRETALRVRDFDSGADPSLAALMFQYGRYLLISSSLPGSQPATLQGKWNDKLKAPWDSKYTININTEMNYWPAEVTNLAETHQPLFRMIDDLAVTGRQTASELYAPTYGAPRGPSTPPATAFGPTAGRGWRNTCGSITSSRATRTSSAATTPPSGARPTST